MALSKLSHVVLVCPHIETNVMKNLISLSFSFLWKNKPDRMKRCDATLPLDKGGLNMPDIEKFWAGLKLSWSRRLMQTDCLWQKILQLNLLAVGHELKDIWFGGPSLVKVIAYKLDNLFWREILSIFANIAEEAHFAHPHFFYHLNLFDNPCFSMNNTEIKRDDFSLLWRKKIIQIGDFFDCSQTPPNLYTLVQFNEKYNLKLNFLNYHRIKTCIINAAKDLNYKTYNPNLSDLDYPRLPLIHKLSCLSNKGCGIFYNTLRARDLARQSTAESEQKWHTELGTVLSVDFWDKIWKLNKGSHFSNKMKWINLQINRFILPTNYTVNKYKPNQDPGCSFLCTTHLETIPNLLWGCPVVREFWNMVGNILTYYYPQFRLGRKEAIFGDISTCSSSTINTLLSLSKQFIWNQKFSSKRLDEVKFINFIKQELKLLMDVMDSRGKIIEFREQFDSILEHFGIL